MSSRKCSFFCLSGQTHASWPCGGVSLARGWAGLFGRGLSSQTTHDSVAMVPQEIVSRLRPVGCRPPSKYRILNPKMVGGTGHYLNCGSEVTCRHGVLDLLKAPLSRASALDLGDGAGGWRSESHHMREIADSRILSFLGGASDGSTVGLTMPSINSKGSPWNSVGA